jgi:type II secretory ATPase GspE/PulE/Tfp pilus assembly ATPase PilB-like protein
MSQEYITQCWNCLGEFDATTAIWCSCNPRSPTKVCPFCLTCFCSASPEFKQEFWKAAPENLREDLSMLGQAKLPIGELLVRANLLTTSQLLEGLKEQKRREGQVRIGELLVEMGFVARESLEYFLKNQQRAASFDLDKDPPSQDLVDKIGFDLCLRKRILPVHWEVFRDKPMLQLAMATPGDSATIDQIQSLTKAQVIPGLAPEEEILKHLKRLFPSGAPAASSGPTATAAGVSAAGGGVATATVAPAPAIVMEPEPETTAEDAAAFVQKFLAGAIQKGASNAQVEVNAAGFTGRCRIDGMQYKVQAPPRRQAEAISHALYDLFKVRAKKKGIAVEARATSRSGDASATLFLRATSTAEGDDFQIKIVPDQGYVVPIAELGLDPATLGSLDEALRNDNGLFAASAPPFHGARSLLYALQQHVAAAGHPCISLESPALVRVSGVNAIEFSGDPGSLERALEQVRSAPPRVLVIPELTDTARAAAVKEMTPLCLVIVAVRARSACEALAALERAGMGRDFLAAHLRGVLNQRLVRTLCSSCRALLPAGEKTLRLLGLNAEDLAGARLYEARGCDQCRPHGGYRGRTALVELLRATPKIRGRIVGGAAGAELLEAVRAEGMIPLRERGLEKLRSGVISPDEFQRGNF